MKLLELIFLVKKRINNYRSWVSYSFARNTFKFGELNEGISFPGNFDVRHSMSFFKLIYAQ